MENELNVADPIWLSGRNHGIAEERKRIMNMFVNRLCKVNYGDDEEPVWAWHISEDITSILVEVYGDYFENVDRSKFIEILDRLN